MKHYVRIPIYRLGQTTQSICKRIYIPFLGNNYNSSGIFFIGNLRYMIQLWVVILSHHIIKLNLKKINDNYCERLDSK